MPTFTLIINNQTFENLTIKQLLLELQEQFAIHGDIEYSIFDNDLWGGLVNDCMFTVNNSTTYSLNNLVDLLPYFKTIKTLTYDDVPQINLLTPLSEQLVNS